MYEYSFINNETVIEYDDVEKIKKRRNVHYILTLIENQFLLNLAIDEEQKSIQRMTAFLKESYPEVLL